MKLPFLIRKKRKYPARSPAAPLAPLEKGGSNPPRRRKEEERDALMVKLPLRHSKKEEVPEPESRAAPLGRLEKEEVTSPSPPKKRKYPTREFGAALLGPLGKRGSNPPRRRKEEERDALMVKLPLRHPKKRK